VEGGLKGQFGLFLSAVFILFPHQVEAEAVVEEKGEDRRRILPTCAHTVRGYKTTPKQES
jgi:hypothetical protein